MFLLILFIHSQLSNFLTLVALHVVLSTLHQPISLFLNETVAICAKGLSYSLFGRSLDITNS